MISMFLSIRLNLKRITKAIVAGIAVIAKSREMCKGNYYSGSSYSEDIDNRRLSPSLVFIGFLIC